MSEKTFNDAQSYGVKIINDSEGSGDNRTGEMRVAVVGAVTLPTGAATAARQDTGNTSLSSIDGKLSAGATNFGKAEDGAHASGETGVFVLGVRRDAVTSGAADGDYVSLNIDANGHLYVIPAIGALAGASIVSSSAYEASKVIKNAAGTLLSLVGYNSKASAQWIQVFNSATVPADTAVPIYSFLVQATSNFALDVPIVGMPFTTGIAVSNSSTGPTKTIGSADVFFTAVLK